MNKIQRDYCIFTKTADLELVYQFNKFPIYMGCTDSEASSDVFEDMSWYISRSTGSIQLNPLLPLDVLYASPHNEAVGNIWNQHHKYFSEFISRFNCKKIFEIGGSNGNLARNYKNIVPDTDWSILEPNPRLQETDDIEVIKEFLTPETKFPEEMDAIVHSHFFEHSYHPREFVENVANSLPTGKFHIFSIPNMRSLLKAGFTNCLNFEHTCFLSEPFVDQLMKNSGFETVEKKYFLDHSIWYATRKTKRIEHPREFPNLFEENSKLFQNFIESNQKTVDRLNSQLESLDGPLFLFGAHVFSQFLVGFGLNTEKVVKILDNGPTKIGKRLYGTRLFVDSPKCLKGLSKAYVILRAANYNDEIKSDILMNINPNVVFLS